MDEGQAKIEDMPKRTTWLKDFVRWAHEVGLERRIAIVLLVIGAVLGILTYLAVTNVWDTEEPIRTVTRLLIGDLFVALLLAIIIAWRGCLLWIGRRRGLAGSKLHSRMVVMFGLIAVIPAIVVSIFSVALLNYGLNTWFSDRIKNAVESSLNVAQSYLAESQQRIGDDTVAIAAELRLNGLLDIGDPDQFQVILDRQLNQRGLSEGVIIDRRLQIMARGGFSLLMEFSLDIPRRCFH